MGRINDYGQTLERSHRQALEERITAFAQLGIDFRYLASWSDPFANVWRYAAEVAAYWKLGDEALLIVFVKDEGEWRVAGWRGAEVRDRLPDTPWLKLIGDAREELLRRHPSRVILDLADRLLGYLRSGTLPPAGRGGPSALALAGMVLGGLYVVVRLARLIRQLRTGII
ncbi:TPM domain-containing protein [Candidatus Bipolaricaulota sp. J31]